MPRTCQICPPNACFVRAVTMTPPHDGAESEASRADLAEMTFSLAQHFDGLRPKQVAAHVRAFLRLYRFDRRTLPKSAKAAGCSRSSLLRAETLLTRILKPSPQR